MLIVSRRQVDCRGLEPGYVSGWTTEGLADELLSVNGPVLLCRDHGGPWQGNAEASVELEEALARASMSIRADIDAGFDLIHIDTSREARGAAAFDDALDRLEALYREAVDYADRVGREVCFEVGFEEQSTSVTDALTNENILERMLDRLGGLPKPTYFVLQTGTLVRGGRNVGDLTSEERHAATVESIRASVDSVRSAGLHVKAHNADYLDFDAIASLASAGVHALNIAPELGTTQTRVIMDTAMAVAGRSTLREFQDIAYESDRWRGWTDDPSVSRRVAAQLAGHYIMSDPRVRRMISILDLALQPSGESLDSRVDDALREVVDRYLEAAR
ncbi:hypothetical protein MHK74_08715 [Microbacterium aurum]|uniref:hypothetical protein n=1 Tax=Microbacterium aurum TaxID=36805 RepID=UPI001EF627DA|nr:hypothetical protein [Microbacterium aurum]MCG7414646.1 hypothetical protein [Microbacterium aurum]